MDNPHAYGKPDIVPEPIEIDYSKELKIRYKNINEYPNPKIFGRIANWYDYNPIVILRRDDGI